MRKLVVCLLISFLPACGLNLQSIMPVHKYGKSYAISDTQTVNAGSTMLSVYNTYLFPAFKPKYTYQPPRAGFMNVPPLTPDQRWVAFYSRDNNYVIQSKDYQRGILGIEIKPNGTLADDRAWINMLKYEGLGAKITSSSWQLPDPQLFIETDGYPKEGSFKAELIYNGIMNNVIAVSYREFVDNMTRVAFYQELKYDLNESPEITFRSIRIKVLNATNNEITFQILEDGNLPWMPNQ